MKALNEAGWRCRFGGASCRGRRWDGLDTGWRQLPLVLLETPRGGAWRLLTERGEWRVEVGETLVVGGGERHRLVAETAGEMRSSWVFLEWEQAGWPLVIRGGAVVVAGKAVARRVEELARRAKEESWAAQVRRVALAFDLLEGVAEHVAPAAAPDARVGRAMRVARERLAEPLRREDLAKAAGVSEAHLHDLFTAATGRAPMEYVLGLRIRRAMELLAEGGTPVGEVGLACGFASPYYFSRYFRKATGQAPREYRAERLKG